MGRFFSNIQIKNNCNDEKQFIKMLSKSLEKHGFVPAKEDDGQISYLLLFSDNGSWVTVCSQDYESNEQKLKEDLKMFSDEIQTSSLGISVVDSDFAMIELRNSSSQFSDSIMIGDGDGYGLSSKDFKGNPQVWEELLPTDKAFENIRKILNTSYVFAEDGLAEFGELLGIPPQNICSEYDEANSGTEEGVVELYFKKKDKKSLTLDAAFRQVFGEALEPLGYVKLKKMKPTCYVRVVDDGILHIITYRKLRLRKIGYETFEILGGIVTLYRRNIHFDINLDRHIKGNHFYYKQLAPELDNDIKEKAIQFHCNVWGVSRERCAAFKKFEDSFRSSIMEFLCKSDDIEAKLYGVRNAFDVTKHIMLSNFNKVTDLNSCIDYFYKTFQYALYLGEFEDVMTNTFYYDSECFLMIKAGYREDITPYRENLLDKDVELIKNRKQGLSGARDIEDYMNSFRQRTQEQMAIRDKMLNDPELNKKVMAELERCKAKNIEYFKSLGYEIKNN